METNAPPLVELKRAVSGPTDEKMAVKGHARTFSTGEGAESGARLPQRRLRRSVSLSRLGLLGKLNDEDGKEEQDCDSTSEETFSSCSPPLLRRRPSQDLLNSIKVPRSFIQEREESLWESFRLGQQLGQGAFGEVFVGVDKATGAKRAIKILSKDRMDPSEYVLIRNEVDIQKDLDHPCINRICHFLESEQEFCITMEMCSGGDLYSEVSEWGALPECDAAVILQQLLSGVKYLHAHRITHRDLNLENVLLVSTQHFDAGIKIIDFGLAKRFEPGQKLTTMCGKLHYISPSVWNKSYTEKYDIWQAGVIAYTILAAFTPFEAPTQAQVREAILKGQFDFEDPAWRCVSDEAKDFCRSLLTHEDEKRPTAEETLHHPWMVKSMEAARHSFRRRSSGSAISALENMRSFSATTKLKELLCTYIATQLLEKDEKKETDLFFQLMDCDRKGKLSYEDIQRGYNDFFQEDLNEGELKDLFHRIDLDGSGFIEYTEFLMACTAQWMLSGHRLEACFKLFDKEGTGYISTDSLMKKLSGMDEESLNNIIWQVDDGCGQISFEKFKIIMVGSD